MSDHRIRLPASEFPNQADVYVCDHCGEDITAHFSPWASHSWVPMAPERFTCACGRPYLTGAVEWDNLGQRERKRRIRDTHGLGLFFSLLSSVVGLLAYFALRALHHGQAAMVIAVVITAFPFAALVVPFWLQVAASMWRTRVKS